MNTEFFINCAGGCHESLGCHLPPEGAGELGFHHRTAVDIAVDLFQSEDVFD